MSTVVVNERLLKPSMSKAGLLLNCQWPWERPITPAPAGEPAWYGNAFHLVTAQSLEPIQPKLIATKKIKKIAKKFNVNPDELLVHVEAAFPVLIDWLQRSNPWKVNLLLGRRRMEIALAYKPLKGTSRIIRPPTEDTHQYLDAKKDDFPGTADLIIDLMPDDARKRDLVPQFLVLDHKTGAEFDAPRDSAQLFSLAIGYTNIIKHRRRVGAAIFHAPRLAVGGVPTVYADEYEPHELDVVAKKLKRAWKGIGRGTLRPGPYCNFCPGLVACPAHANALVQIGKVDMELMTPEKIGALHEAFQRFGAFEKQVKDNIMRPWLAKNGPGVRPDGKLVVIKEREVERVSKKNVIEAVGAKKAEDVFEEWRKKNYLVSDTEERMEAVSDK